MSHVAHRSSATHCSYCYTMQCTTTHCNTLQHTATHCNTLQHTATHCNTRHESCRTPIIRNTLRFTAAHCSTLQRTATHCHTLHHTATHAMSHAAHQLSLHNTAYCSTLQHTTTHCNTLYESCCTLIILVSHSRVSFSCLFPVSLSYVCIIQKKKKEKKRSVSCVSFSACLFPKNTSLSNREISRAMTH